MATTSMLRPIGQDSQPPLSQEPKPKTQRYEKLKALSYGILALITSIAILALSTGLSFIGVGLLLSKLWGPGGGIHMAMKWFFTTLGTSAVLGPLFSIYPIKKIAGPIFALAKAHWQKS